MLSARHGPIFYLPCANRMSIIRTGAVYNADGRYPHGKVLFCPLPCASLGSYRHGMGTISDCLAPIPEVLFVRHAVYLPCMPCPTTRTDVIRTARCYFTPRRVQSEGCYRHRTGPFSTCLAPTAGILLLRVPCTTRTDVIRTARCYFATCRVQC